MTISVTKPEVPEKPEDREVVLSIQGVSKKFCRDLKRSLFYGVQDITSELLGVREKSDKLRKKEFWALKDVSFELRRGEALGLVGKNGSGKSTLLRIIAGLIRPDTGSVEVKGRVAPLIALGAGFNPILTGRENIYANMSILGLSKKEIDERFDEVVEFAEIGDAIDAPVQTYSSGMAARLGFASAIHTDPDILLIDEVLAVGDIKFRAKCFNQLSRLQKNGTAFVLVTHNAHAIVTVCNLALYISKGKTIMSGETDAVISKYEKDLFGEGIETFIGALLDLSKESNVEGHSLKITSLAFKDLEGNILNHPKSGEYTCFSIGCIAYKELEGVNIYLEIKEKYGESYTSLYLDNLYDNQLLKIIPGERSIDINMPYLCLKPGKYVMKVIIRKSLETLDCFDCFNFIVETDRSLHNSSFYQPRDWCVK